MAGLAPPDPPPPTVSATLTERDAEARARAEAEAEAEAEAAAGVDADVKAEVTYGIDDVPPWYLCLFLALQHYLTMIGGVVAIPFVLCPALCMADDDPDRALIVCTMIFVTGAVTWAQCTWGVRLPLVQGGTISFLVPTLAVLSQPQWRCPAPAALAALDGAARRALWTDRMCELSGDIAVAAAAQAVLGYTGVIGAALRWVTPLTVAPTVALVGLTLFEHAARAASTDWPIAISTSILLTLFSQCLPEVRVPLPALRVTSGPRLRLRVVWFPLFKLFPVLLALGLMWGVCGALTAAGALPAGHAARTDARGGVLAAAPWLRVPWPGQWGAPRVSLAGALGMLAGVLACTIESIAYYPTTARLCAAAAVPRHAFNRGLGTEGLGCVLAGLCGAGNGTNTFGENVAALGVTRVGARRVVQWAAALMLLQGAVGKAGALLVLVPTPVVGGLFCVMFGLIAAFGLAALRHVSLRSSRNLYVLGVSLFLPLVVSRWAAAAAAAGGAVRSGLPALDAVLDVLLSTSILLAAVTGALLDHVIPGSDEERGLVSWARELTPPAAPPAALAPPSTYDFPMGMSYVRRWRWTSYCACMPTYEEGKFTALLRGRRPAGDAGGAGV